MQDVTCARGTVWARGDKSVRARRVGRASAFAQSSSAAKKKLRLLRQKRAKPRPEMRGVKAREPRGE